MAATISISRTKAVELIKSNAGNFMTVEFLKKDKTLRKLNCIFKKDAITELGYVTVFDIKGKGYKNIDPRTLKSLSVAKTKYTIKQ